MRPVVFTVLGFTFLALLAPQARSEDCTAKVTEAFQKQRSSKAFRVAMTQPSAEGDVELIVDYMPPDRMLQTVKSPAMPGDQQTMLVGNRAYAGSSGAYEELLPQFTQSIIAEFNSAMGSTGKEIGAFECMGKADFEGKSYLAFRALDKAAPADVAPDKLLARTIYIDPDSGLPAFNVVAAVSGKDAPILKAIYSYPTDLVIEAPQGAPIQKMHQ